MATSFKGFPNTLVFETSNVSNVRSKHTADIQTHYFNHGTLCIVAISRILTAINGTRPLPDDFAWFAKENNPFTCYPNYVIQEFISCLGRLTRGNQDKVSLSKDVVRLLLCRNLDHLDLSPVHIRVDEMSDVLRMIVPLTANLHTLCLFPAGLGLNLAKDLFFEMLRDTKIEENMLDLVHSLKNVSHLYLHNICFDALLGAVGASCPNLVVLGALSEHVTDAGLKSLCVNAKDPLDTAPRCQSLQKILLDPQASGISIEGVEFLLRHLPLLSDVEGCTIGHVLEAMHADDYRTCGRTYSLQHFMYDWRESHRHVSRGAEIAVRICPRLTTLKLLEPTDESLVVLGSLTCLTEISIISCLGTVTFARGVLPLLQSAGANVTKLSLSLKIVDLGAIDYFCPRLKFLDCITEEITESQLQLATSFSHLEDLVFHANLANTLTVASIKRLLSHCHGLESLYVSCCNTLTDSVLREILEKNPLLKLQYLHLIHIEGLTFEGLDLLLNQESDLKRIWLFDTGGVYRDAIRRIKERIKECNLDLVINDVLL